MRSSPAVSRSRKMTLSTETLPVSCGRSRGIRAWLWKKLGATARLPFTWRCTAQLAFAAPAGGWRRPT
eukprot:8572711-Pyramimonas_sp.AAC.1